MVKIESDGEVSVMMMENSNFLMPYNSRHTSKNNSRNNSRHNSRRGSSSEIKDLVLHQSSQRPSQLYSHRPSIFVAQRKMIIDLFASKYGSSKSLNNLNPGDLKEQHKEEIKKVKNRRMGNDALTIVLSSLYAKFLFVLGIALPITDIVSNHAPADFYKAFYLYLNTMSILFILFVYVTHIKNRKYFDIIDNYEKCSGDTKLSHKKRVIKYGSFYLRVGSIAFGIGSMVYSGLAFGQYFELKADDKCQNIFIALNPAFRILLIIMQMQLIFLNTKELNMMQNKVISRFGLMHLVATNLCEWVHVLVEETKHEIDHLIMYQHDKNSTLGINHSFDMDARCTRRNIMGKLVQNASPFLFPCTVEYSLICAVILYEMWKKIRKNDETQREHHESIKGFHTHKAVKTLTLDCSKAHRGMFCGILVTVLTIISLIMFFVLAKGKKSYKTLAVLEVTYCEIILYIITSIAVLLGFYKMRDLKFSKVYLSGIGLDCTLLVLAQSGVYIYSMFSIMGCYFTIDLNHYSKLGLYSESLSFIQTTIQTIFILNAWWRRIKGKKENHEKPGREIITFLLVANMAIWFINALVKGHAAFRPTHLEFFGRWTWVIITHLSMPLAIFYRFHSTICLFEIWKISYKIRKNTDVESNKS